MEMGFWIEPWNQNKQTKKKPRHNSNQVWSLIALPVLISLHFGGERGQGLNSGPHAELYARTHTRGNLFALVTAPTLLQRLRQDSIPGRGCSGAGSLVLSLCLFCESKAMPELKLFCYRASSIRAGLAEVW